MLVVKQNKWKDVVERWEDNSTQKHLTYMIDSFNRGYKNEPYVEQIFGIITAFAATMYTYAYSYDNITRVLYARYAMQLKGFQKLSGNEMIKQKELFMKVLKTMPSGFKDYSYMNGGFLNVPDGTSLTVQKANQFIDYIQSSGFNELMTNIAISDFSKSYEKSK